MASSKSMLKGLIGFSVVPIATALITLFVIPVVSNVFPAEEYGKINMFYSMGVLLLTALTLGLDNSFIRYYFEPPKGFTNKSIQLFALIVGIATTAVVTFLVTLFAAEPVSYYMFGEYRPGLIFLLGIYVAALILFRYLNTDARMQEKVGRYSIQSIAQVFITRIAFVFVALFSTFYAYSIVAMTIGMLALSLFFSILQRRTLALPEEKVPAESVRTLFAFGVPVMMTNFVLNLNGMVGKLVMSGAGMYEAVGIFAIATTLSNVFAILPTAFSAWWSPFMYKNYKMEQATISKVHDLVMLGAAAIVALIIALQNVLFAIVGGSYAACQSYFMIIMLNPIQALICETTSYGIVLSEKPKYNVYASVLGVAASFVVTIALVGSLGVYAAALGVAASSLVTGVLRSVIGQRLYKTVASPAKTISTALLIVAACFLNGFLCESVPAELIGGVAMLSIVLVAYRRQALEAIKSLRKAG